MEEFLRGTHKYDAVWNKICNLAFGFLLLIVFPWISITLAIEFNIIEMQHFSIKYSFPIIILLLATFAFSAIMIQSLFSVVNKGVDVDIEKRNKIIKLFIFSLVMAIIVILSKQIFIDNLKVY